MLEDVKVGDSASFSLYGSSGISNISNARVVSILSGKNLTERVIAASNHSSIYPDIPQTLTNVTQDDFESYNYLTVETISGETVTLTEIGIPWIIPASFVIADRGTALVTISNFDSDDLSKLTEVLRLYGFPSSSIVVT